MTRIGLAYNLKPLGAALGVTSDYPARAAGRVVATDGAALADRPSEMVAALDAFEDEYAEWDAPATVDAVEAALAPLGTVVRLEANREFPARIARERLDIVFNMAEGLYGPNRESHVPAILEFLDIPYSGSDAFTLALCLDKAHTKESLNYAGIPTAPFARIATLSQLESVGRRAFPMFVKPVHEGSSKGITVRSMCQTPEELREQVAFLLERYRQPVLVESYLPGEEYTCALLGNGDAVAALPLVAMRFDGLPAGAPPIYGFEAKWLWDTPASPLPIFECPARIDEGLREAIEQLAVRTFQVLGCRDWARIDVRLDARGVPNVIEVNPLPGILPDPAEQSCFPHAARAAGIGYDELIQRCLLLAAARQDVEIRGAPAFSHVRARTPPHALHAR